MPVKNPVPGPFKPHLRMTRSGMWVVVYRSSDGTLWSGVQVSFMTRNSKKAAEAEVWAANRNARTLANRGLRYEAR